MKLRRYLPADAGIKTIKDRQLRVGRLNRLNDITDLSVIYRQGGMPIPESLNAMQNKRLIDINAAKYGILCFSQIHREKMAMYEHLMWAHYARGHTGLCLEIETERLSDGQNLTEVQYGQPVEIDIEHFDESRPEPQDELMKKIRLAMASKRLCWQHEIEYRVFVDLNSTQKVISPDGAEVHHLVGLPTDALTGIHLGAGMHDSLRHHIVDLLRYHKIKVPVYSTSLHSVDQRLTPRLLVQT